MLISTGASLLPCLGVGLVPATGTKVLRALTGAEADETGATGVETGLAVGTGGVTGLKKGRDRLPQPGILTSQPEEMRSKSNSMAEKIDRLFKVSRNRVPRNAISGIGCLLPISASSSQIVS